jgi:hypothetical protein
MDSTFVRKAFYLEPPDKNAKPEAWDKWIKAESLKARAAKASFTRKQAHSYMPQMGMSKIGGVWRQSVMVGLSGSADNETLTREILVDASQEKDIEVARQIESAVHRRGGNRKNRNARRRAKARTRRKSKHC